MIVFSDAGCAGEPTSHAMISKYKNGGESCHLKVWLMSKWPYYNL